MQRRASSWYGATIARVGQTSMHAVQLPQCAAHRRIDRQRQVGEDLAEKEPRAVVPVEQVGVLADPAEARVARERLLEHRSAVGERTIAGRTDRRGKAIGQSREPRAQHLVIVAAERIARDVAESAVGEHGLRLGRAGPVVHARSDHAQRAGHQFRGPGALRAVTLHVAHFAVPARGQPVEQPSLVVGQLDGRDADLLEAEFAAPGLDRHGEFGQVHAHCFAAGGRGRGSIMRVMTPLPFGIYTAQQVRDLDRRAIDGCGIPGYELMTRAGHAALNALRALWPAARSICVLCGPGNNGGDGYVIARVARAQGLRTTVVALADPTSLRGDARHAYDDFAAAGGRCGTLDSAGARRGRDRRRDLRHGTRARGDWAAGRGHTRSERVAPPGRRRRRAVGPARRHRSRARCRRARSPHRDLHRTQAWLLYRPRAGPGRSCRVRRPRRARATPSRTCSRPPT